MRLHLWHDGKHEGEDTASAYHKDEFVTAWFRDFRVALLRVAEEASLADADVIVADLDTFVPHYPSFLEACSTYPFGGKTAFFNHRVRRWAHLWHSVRPRLLELMGPSQRLLLLDVESEHTPGSKEIHQLKKSSMSDPEDHRVVHVSLCLDAKSYRPGVDVSFPAVLPAALGSAEQLGRPFEYRPYLLTFKGRRTHGVRMAVFALHNGRDIHCVDSSDEIMTTRRQSGIDYCPADAWAKELHAKSKFAMCPRGDAVYSFRMAEALSCGAVPVIIGDGWVLPFSEVIDYREVCICVRETPEDLEALPARLRAIPDARVRAYQAAGRRAFVEHMQTLDKQAATLLDILDKRRRQSYAQSAHHQVVPTLTPQAVPLAVAHPEAVPQPAQPAVLPGKVPLAQHECQSQSDSQRQPQRSQEPKSQWRSCAAYGGDSVCTERERETACWRPRRPVLRERSALRELFHDLS